MSCSSSVRLISRWLTKRSILPSESQVMSASTARRVGASPRRWIGMIGNSWSMAQLSGSDWNTDMLQK
jgi:hypothetical protein